MALQNVKPDNNVSFRAGRPHCEVIGIQPTLLRHQGTIDGTRPSTASITADNLNPVVSAGKAEWLTLNHGGLFLDYVANCKKAMIIESIDGGTPTIVKASDGTTVVRATPVTFPWRLAAGECLKFASGSDIRVMARLDAQKVL